LGNIRVSRKVFTLSSGLLSPQNPSLSDICRVRKFYKISVWNADTYSAFNAQGSRLIIVVVQLGAVKIYVAAVEALRKKERQDETQFTTKIDGFLSF
jgi:electron transfer flavoprotein alpha/beta subunit